MTLARSLLVLSALLLAATGLGYLFVPAAMLSVVGIGGSPTEVFLIRTEGVALVTAAALTETARRAGGRAVQLALVILAFYLVAGSLIDLIAFRDGIVGPASVPSAIGANAGRGPLPVRGAEDADDLGADHR